MILSSWPRFCLYRASGLARDLASNIAKFTRGEIAINLSKYFLECAN